jgi:uncharacterized protein (DUF2236 family)
MSSVTSPEPVLGQLDAAVTTGFGRGSTLRRVASEPISFLGVLPILVMDVAHPSVGAGVRDHSRFRRTPYRRLWGTADAGLRMVFGDERVARGAAEQVYRFHDFVHGEVDSSGAAYTAHDAGLLLWVWATLVVTLEQLHDRWVAPLADDDRAALYADFRAFGRFFGIPDALLPPDWAAFAAYFDGVLDSGTLRATSTTRQQVRDVLWFRHPLVPPFVVWPMRVLAIGLLDERVRKEFGLELDARDQRVFGAVDGALSRWYRRLPDVRRAAPYVYVTLRKPTIGLKKRLGLGR